MYWVLFFLKFRLEIMCQMLWMFPAWYCGNLGAILVHNIYDLQEVCQKLQILCRITKSWKALQHSGYCKYLVKTREISFWDQELCSTISFWRSHTLCIILSANYNVIVLEMSVVTLIDSRAADVFQWPKRRHMFYILCAEISAMFTRQWHEKNIMSKIICDGPVRLTAGGCSILNTCSFKCMPFVNFYGGWQNNALKDPLFGMLGIGHTIQRKRKQHDQDKYSDGCACVCVCTYMHIHTYIHTFIHTREDPKISENV